MRKEAEINSDALSCEDEFNRLPLQDKVVLKEKFSSQHYKLIEVAMETFYLADEFDNYLGCVKLKNGLLVSIHSKLKSGFYNLMFSGILAYTDCKEILSDSRLSGQAIKSYANLADKGHLLVQVLTKEGYKPFSREELLSDTVNRVSVKAKIPLKEHIDEFPREGTYDVTLFNKRSPAYDERIFCEPIAVHNCTTEFLESIDYPIPSNKR